MTNSIYIGAAGQLALSERLETIAYNLANMSSVGFRSEHVTFRTILSNVGGTQVAFPSSDIRSLSTLSGAIRSTGNPLDIAMRGPGWFAVQTPGGAAFTRDGRLQVSPDGTLLTITGYPILDAGFAIIQSNTGAGPLQIGKDGAIIQQGDQIGAIGIFSFPAGTSFQRGPNATVIPDNDAIVMLDFDQYGVDSSHVELANNNPVLDVTRLMTIQRTFEMLTNGMDMIDSAKREFIRSIGNGPSG